MRVIAFACLVLVACNDRDRPPENASPAARADGRQTTRSFPVRDFTAIEVAGPDNVDVTTGSDFAVRAEGSANILDQLEIVRNGDTLRIRRTEGRWSEWAKRRGDAVRITVTMPAVRAVELAGSGDVAIDRTSGDFTGTIAGSGDMVIGQMNDGVAALTVAGSGTLAAAGQVDRIEMNIAGSGDIAARDLRASDAEVSIAGSGDATADVTGDARVSLVGSGSATLGRNARCTVSRIGSGQAVCG